jgi:Dna[CI] antecedent, DciA
MGIQYGTDSFAEMLAHTYPVSFSQTILGFSGTLVFSMVLWLHMDTKSTTERLISFETGQELSAYIPKSQGWIDEAVVVRRAERQNYYVPNTRPTLPKGYDGIENSFASTNKGLEQYINRISRMMKESPQTVIESWASIVGPAHAPMAKARSFVDGVLEVTVNNSMLYSLFCQFEYFKLLDAVRKRNPGSQVKKLKFVRI